MLDLHAVGRRLSKAVRGSPLHVEVDLKALSSVQYSILMAPSLKQTESDYNDTIPLQALAATSGLSSQLRSIGIVVEIRRRSKKIFRTGSLVMPSARIRQAKGEKPVCPPTGSLRMSSCGKASRDTARTQGRPCREQEAELSQRSVQLRA